MNIWPDILRSVIMLLFAASIAEIVWIVRVYYSISVATRRLLPIHVFLVGISTILLATEAITENLSRLGQPLNWHAPYNIVALSLLYLSLFTVRRHLRHRVQMMR